MAISIDWGTGVITVPQSFLIPLGGTSYQLDTNAFRIALRDLEDDEAGAVFPPTHNHNTKVLLGGIEYARIIEILSPYTVTFEDVGSPYKVFLTGSNNNILDVTNLNNVSVAPNNSAGLVQMAEIEFGAFDGGVWVDQQFGTPGTLYPIGTPRKPVSNFADAVTIANARGFSTLFIIGNVILDTGDNVSGFKIIGQNAARSHVTANAGANISNVDITECSFTGVLDGNAIMRSCFVYDVSYFSGFLYECEIAGTITLSSGAQADILSCYSGVPGSNTPIIDMGGSGQALGLRRYAGGVKIQNKAGTDAASIDLASGQVKIDLATVNNGSLVVRGTGKVIASDGSDDHLVSGTYGSLQLTNETVSGAMVQEIWTLHGLDPDAPLNVTTTARTAGGISQNISGDGETNTTVTRQ